MSAPETITNEIPRHHDAPVYVRRNGVPVFQATYTMTGGRSSGVRHECSDFAIFGEGLAFGAHGALDAPEQIASGAVVGALMGACSRGFGPRRESVQVWPTYCARGVL